MSSSRMSGATSLLALHACPHGQRQLYLYLLHHGDELVLEKGNLKSVSILTTNHLKMKNTTLKMSSTLNIPQRPECHNVKVVVVVVL
jgi:hypothetical protein